MKKRQAAVDTARAKLEQAEADLDEEMAGPDPLVLAKLEAVAEAVRAKLEQAKSWSCGKRMPPSSGRSISI